MLATRHEHICLLCCYVEVPRSKILPVFSIIQKGTMNWILRSSSHALWSWYTDEKSTGNSTVKGYILNWDALVIHLILMSSDFRWLLNKVLILWANCGWSPRCNILLLNPAVLRILRVCKYILIYMEFVPLMSLFHIQQAR